jgi:hypothetical protein
MLLKKSKAVIAAVLSAAMVTNAMVATVASAAESAGTRTKDEAYGDSTYAERFLSLYDDVVTNGQENGYLSSNGASSTSFGIPYHAVEEVIVEAPDYGHETTSEAMSYLVWVAAMRDNIATNMQDQVSTSVEYTGDLAKAWATMENMIPTVQDSFWTASSVSAQYCDEYDDPTDCPHSARTDLTASNPIHSYFTKAYSSDSGLYLMHWLADVDNWYGYGSGTSFTFINTFQRGEQESCWETVPHPSIEEKKYGNSSQGIKGIFNGESTVTAQWAYTNAPDAEDRAIQAVYDANRWGVGVSSVSTKAGKMGDELRNNMFDKYYQKIGADSSLNSWNSTGYESCHYLMNWYTSWGGALKSSGQDWVWQIGCSHVHEFYQNPLAAFALLTDSDLNSSMKAEGATRDYTTSLERQVELYLWLQSSDGPIAGGATNSYKGRYETYPTGVSQFYGMMYVEHPVYADPGSNHWIGNQVWAVQRLAELYYWVKTEGDSTGVKPGGMSLESALEQILDNWVAWFVNNTVLTEDGDYYIPSNLDWSGQPDTWTGTATSNSGLSCTITGYGNTDLGCVSSLANTLLYYSKAKGASASDLTQEYDVGASYKSGIDGVSAQGGTAYTSSSADLPAASLYLAQQLLDREWDLSRDDIGLTRTDHNGSLARFFAQEVYIPTAYSGTMPNGDSLTNGATFLSIRSMYTDQSKCKGVKTSDEAIALVKELQAAYDKDVAAGANWSGSNSASSDAGKAELAGFTNVASVDLEYHRFWHAGDIMMALGTMAELYPDITPTIQYGEDDGDVLYGDVNCDGEVNILDVIALNRNLLGSADITAQGKINADVDLDGTPTSADSLNIMKYVIHLLESLPV